MKNKGGFVVMHRSIIEHDIFNNDGEYKLFSFLIYKARFKKDESEDELQVGEYLDTKGGISKDLGWGLAKLDKNLKALIDQGNLEVRYPKKNYKGVIIKVVDWLYWQGKTNDRESSTPQNELTSKTTPPLKSLQASSQNRTTPSTKSLLPLPPKIVLPKCSTANASAPLQPPNNDNNDNNDNKGKKDDVKVSPVASERANSYLDDGPVVTVKVPVSERESSDTVAYVLTFILRELNDRDPSERVLSNAIKLLDGYDESFIKDFFEACINYCRFVNRPDSNGLKKRNLKKLIEDESWIDQWMNADSSWGNDSSVLSAKQLAANKINVDNFEEYVKNKIT